MTLTSLARAVGTSHPTARDPQISQPKPRLLLLASNTAISPLSGRPIDDLSPAPWATIETARLILRPMQAEDFPAYLAMMSSADSFPFSNRDTGLDADEAWTRFLRHSGHWQMLGYGSFAVFEKGTGMFVGEVGFGDFHRQLGDDFDPYPEACWTIVGDARGKGYATEAAQAAVRWLEVKLGKANTVCIIHSRHRASLRIARKLGFKPFRYTEFRGYPAIFFRRDAATVMQR